MAPSPTMIDVRAPRVSRGGRRAGAGAAGPPAAHRPPAGVHAGDRLPPTPGACIRQRPPRVFAENDCNVVSFSGETTVRFAFAFWNWTCMNTWTLETVRLLGRGPALGGPCTRYRVYITRGDPVFRDPVRIRITSQRTVFSAPRSAAGGAHRSQDPVIIKMTFASRPAFTPAPHAVH